VSVETLAGKRVAVDASIWMVQFMRAMRDDSGEMLRDAHLLGFLRRICKLLFLRVRPVFVFDGATPALKRRTLAARRRHRDAAQAKVRKTAEKLLLSHVSLSSVRYRYSSFCYTMRTVVDLERILPILNYSKGKLLTLGT
jgi:DNA excision repair protein ERCC-5